MSDAVIEYLSQQQAVRQWKLFMTAFAEEVSSQWQVLQAQEFMQTTGVRFARTLKLGVCHTLNELQMAMSSAWVTIDWGWVELEQHADHLKIHHFCAPLRACLGDASGPWAPAFLEGVYQEWFEQANPGTVLRVRRITHWDAAGSIELRLGRK